MQKFGFINVYKLTGFSSASCVGKVKRLAKKCYNANIKCGHMGTLDPLASGVLPIAVGNATRLFDYLLEKKKKYLANFKFGFLTDTLDVTGIKINETSFIPTEKEILNVLPNFLGKQQQIPPMYSAKSVDGKRCYDLARQGINLDLKANEVEIYQIKIVKQIDESEFQFEIECGGGTYIRSICRDIAFRLNSLATMTALERARSGVFDKSQSILLDDLNEDNFFDKIIPTETLIDYEKIFVDKISGFRLFNGIDIEIDKADGLYSVYDEKTFYGIGEVNSKKLKIRTKLC